MLRILIIGASKGTGALAAEAALEKGHEVTAFARNPQNLSVVDPRLTRQAGDFHDPASVSGAVLGHDAVILTASATSMRAFKAQPSYFSLGTGYVIDAMKAHGVKRLVVLSALGVGESRKQMGFLLDKLMVSWLLKLPYADHERQEALVKASGLDWVIARPSRLTNGPARDSYQRQTGDTRVPKAISRADVASFLVEAATTNTWLGKAVQLGG